MISWIIIIFLLVLCLELTIKYFYPNKIKLKVISPLKMPEKVNKKQVEYIVYILNACIIDITYLIIIILPFTIYFSLQISFLILFLLIYISYKILIIYLTKPKKEKHKKEKNKNRTNFYYCIFFSILLFLILLIHFNILSLIFLILTLLSTIIFYKRENQTMKNKR